MTNYLPAFSLHDLAQISDWLDEQGELCVDMYDGIWADQYFIRSVKDLKLLVLEQSHRYRVIFTIYRTTSFCVHGIADEQLLERALQVVPNGKPFHFVEYVYYPDRICGTEDETDHWTLLTLIEQHWGKTVALGPGPFFWSNNVDAIPTIEVWTVPNSSSMPLPYAPYDADPSLYQWIVDMWRE